MIITHWNDCQELRIIVFKNILWTEIKSLLIITQNCNSCVVSTMFNKVVKKLVNN